MKHCLRFFTAIVLLSFVICLSYSSIAHATLSPNAMPKYKTDDSEDIVQGRNIIEFCQVYMNRVDSCYDALEGVYLDFETSEIKSSVLSIEGNKTRISCLAGEAVVDMSTMEIEELSMTPLQGVVDDDKHDVWALKTIIAISALEYDSFEHQQIKQEGEFGGAVEKTVAIWNEYFKTDGISKAISEKKDVLVYSGVNYDYWAHYGYYPNEFACYIARKKDYSILNPENGAENTIIDESQNESIDDTQILPMIDVNVSDFRLALSDMCKFLSTGFSDALWNYSGGDKEAKGDYLITESDNVRFVTDMTNHSLRKVSVLMEYNNQGASLKQLAVAAVIEGQLYNKSYISDSDKHRSLQYAQDVMDSLINLYSDNISAVYLDGKNGSKLLAAKGKDVNYYFELINSELYVSEQFAELPNEII